MTSTVVQADATTPKSPATATAVSKGSKRGRPVQQQQQQPASREAQRLAAAILEVLAGVRTPTDAAAALGLSPPRYYLWEQRALAALVAGCEPRPAGRAVSERHQLTVLQKEVARLKQDCARQQALVRAAQRTIGLGPPPAAKPIPKTGGKAAGKPGNRVAGKGKRKRRPVARALKAVAVLEAASAADVAAPSSTAALDVLQRCVESSSPQTAVSAP